MIFRADVLPVTTHAHFEGMPSASAYQPLRRGV